MDSLAPLFNWMALHLPFCEGLSMGFMQRAMLGLAMLAPICAVMGVKVVTFRMAFFSDAISHSAFAGVALGLILGVSPNASMTAFGLLIGLGIIAVGRRGALSSDTVIGVFFSAAVAFGLAMISRERHVAADMQRFLYGDILTIGWDELVWLATLFAAFMAFELWSYNRLLYLGINPSLAQAHGVQVAVYQYLFAAMLSITVIFAVWAVGVLLVTALLIVPAAAARNMARSAGGMFWWALAGGLASAMAGLILSAQPACGTATGATVVLCASAWFVVTLMISGLAKRS